MKNLIKQLGKDSVVYGFGDILSRVLGFISIPIFTRLFSPAEFGILDLIVTMVAFSTEFMNCGLDSAQSYFFMEAKNNQKTKIKKVLGAILQLRLIIGLIICIFVWVFHKSIFNAFNIAPQYLQLAILVPLIAFAETNLRPHLELFRLTYKPWQYLKVSVGRSVLVLAFSLAFVMFLELNLFGYFLGTFTGAVIMVLMSYWMTLGNFDLSTFHKELWSSLLKFGIPMLPAGLLVWVMNSSDRWFIASMMTATDLGLYAVGSKVVLLFLVLVGIFRKAWWPIALDVIHRQEGKAFIRKVSLYYLLASTLTAVVITFLSPYIVQLLAPKDFSESWKIVGYLCWVPLFFGFYLISGIGIFVGKKTHYLPLIFGMGALVNLLLNYLLIPGYGLQGAAIASSISALCANIVSMWVSNRYYRVGWDWFKYLLILLPGVYFSVSFCS